MNPNPDSYFLALNPNPNPAQKALNPDLNLDSDSHITDTIKYINNTLTDWMNKQMDEWPED